MNQTYTIVITKSSIKKELLAWNSKRSFIIVSELAEALHIGRDATRSFVIGLDYIQQGNRKDFLVDEVAERLASMKESGGGAR